MSGNDPEPLAGGALARAEPAWLRAKLDQLGDGKKVSLLAAPRVGLPAPCVLGRALRLALAGPRVDILPTPVTGINKTTDAVTLTYEGGVDNKIRCAVKPNNLMFYRVTVQ